MLAEDKRSATCKKYWDSLEDKLNIHAEGNIVAASQLGFQEGLPTAFGYIQDDTVKYEFGSGADNEDELHDLVAEMERQKEVSRYLQLFMSAYIYIV